MTGNVWILSQHVNAAKSTMTLDEFIALCREVTAWANRSDDGLIIEADEQSVHVNGLLF